MTVHPDIQAVLDRRSQSASVCESRKALASASMNKLDVEPVDAPLLARKEIPNA